VTPRLILINGVPASGKSTLARAWCERHAPELPLAIDIDTIRSMLGGWRDAVVDAGLAARDIAVAGIEVHLRSGRDVVVAQYLRRSEFIDRLESAAAACGAIFVETALEIDAADAQSRFRERAAAGGTHDRHGELDAGMVAVVQDFEVFLSARPRVIRLAAGDLALDSLEAAVARGGR
jgi:predicted ABC-type ATPase